MMLFVSLVELNTFLFFILILGLVHLLLFLLRIAKVMASLSVLYYSCICPLASSFSGHDVFKCVLVVVGAFV